jgi:hypothetical protein
MCSIDPLYRSKVDPQRLQTALAVIADAANKLTYDRAIEVIHELGYGDAITYKEEERGSFQPGYGLNLTELQTVAVAAGLAARAQCNGEVVERGS